MNGKGRIKRLISVALALALVLGALPAAAPVSALEPSGWGQFAVEYGKRYREQHPDAVIKPPEPGSYADRMTRDYSNALYNGSKEVLSNKLKEKTAQLLTAGDQELLKKTQELLEYSYKHIPGGKRGSKKMKIWRAENNMFKEGIKEAESGIKTGAAKAARAVNVVFFLWNGYEYITKEETVTYDSPFYQFCADTVGAMAVVGVFLPQYGWVLTATDVVVNSETMKKLVNESSYGKRGGFWDDLTDFNNQQWQNLWEPSMHWWYGGQIEENERLANEMKQKCRGASCTANGVSVYKPNLYLYPQAEEWVEVRFALPELLTVTDPPYADRWQVLARPDGTLTLEGETYGYLFYESQTDPRLWQREAGYWIPADARAEAFTAILRGYGLNDREIRDFNEFWVEKLDPGRDYAMYPQLTPAVELAMPMTLSPAPDSLHRLWFAFVPDAVPLRPASPLPLPRTGFTAIEWGGFVLE